jgi:hypothetical protein
MIIQNGSRRYSRGGRGRFGSSGSEYGQVAGFGNCNIPSASVKYQRAEKVSASKEKYSSKELVEQLVTL